MDNNVSISRNKDGANDSLNQATKMEDKKESADGDGQRGDRSLIEVKPEIPVVDLLDAEEKNMVNTDPVWLKKYDTCEEVTTNGEGEKITMKKESGDEDKTNKTAEGCKAGEIKTEADTLILEIDNTDNLDAYLERTKNKAKTLKNENTAKHNLTVENLEKIEKPAECTLPPKTEAVEENPATPEKSGDSTLASTNASKKKSIKKEVAKKRSTGKANPAKPLSDESEKIIKTLQQKREEPPPKKVQCKTEPTNDDNCKNQVEVEKKPNIEKAADKPVRTLSDTTIKTEDKKLESRFIWISNISKNTKATDLKLHLTSYGKVMTAKIVTDGKLYYGYVVMEKRDDVGNCIKNLDGTVFEGKKIRLSDRVPEKKPNKNQDVEQIQVKTEPISPEQTKTTKNVPEVKPNKEKVERKRTRRSHSHDPLTLKVKDPPRRFDRFSEERRRRKNEEELRRNRERASEEQRRKREIEREREERRKQKIKEEEHRQTELKLERERKKLERERELIERERLDLLRLQKKLADTERCMLSRQKVEIERNIRNISEDYKKRKSPGGFEEDNRKNKFARVEMEAHRRPPENRDYWKSERRTSPIKGKKECFNIESYPTKKSGREDNAGVAPPPPILTDSFDLSDRRRKEKEREWESRAYDKKEFSERPVFKDRKAIEDYNFGGDRRERVQEKQYNRERYKPKYEKTPTGNWEKISSSTSYKSVPSSASWRNDVVRVIQRHPPSGFPVPPQYGSTAGMTHFYPQPEYARPTEFYGRPPDRKY